MTQDYAATDQTGRSARASRRRTLNGSPIECLEGRQLLSTMALLKTGRSVAAEMRTSTEATGHSIGRAPTEATRHAVDKTSTGSVEALARRGKGVPKDPALTGSWTRPVKFKPAGARGPFVAIHASLLPNGKVLSWGHDYDRFMATNQAAQGTPNILLWDPATNSYKASSLGRTNLFCSGHAFLPDGRLIVVGGHGPAHHSVKGLQKDYGHNHTEVYDFRTDSWQRQDNVRKGRYYPSVTTLGNGEILTLAGRDENRLHNPDIELFSPSRGWKVARGANLAAYRDWYPHVYQLSNGTVYGSVPGAQTFFIDPAGEGRIWAGPRMTHSRRYYGTSAMYDVDKIIAIGGASRQKITKSAETIDLSVPNPAWRPTQAMNSRRYLNNATVLPDGSVLVTGGTARSSSDGSNALAGAVYAAEQWDPGTGRWSRLASMQTPRLYHSMALLLPDGRVLVAGGGQPESSGEPEGTIHQDMQIFSPPYMFKGPRPLIVSAPSTARHGETISVVTKDGASIAEARLISLSSVTHGSNMGQRSVPVSLRQQDGGLAIDLPANPNAAPPGYYMLFIENNQGVPSVASMIQLGG